MVTGVRPGHAHSTFGRVPSRHSAAYIHPSHKAVVCVCPKTMTRVQQPEYETQNAIKPETMKEREMDEAIRVTEEKLIVLKNAVQRQRAKTKTKSQKEEQT